MTFKAGDRVRFLDDVGEGVVIKVVDENTILIEDDTGFQYDYPSRQLLLVENRHTEAEAYESVEPSLRDIIDRNIDPAAVEKANKDFEVKYKNNKATNQKRRGEFMEVDLHMSELVDSEIGIEPAEKLEIQMAHFDRMLKMAERQRIPRVIFIHGVGQGVLRAEIRKVINQYYPNASFHDASYSEYGHGATEVRLSPNR
jgi:hypothetical protein